MLSLVFGWMIIVELRHKLRDLVALVSFSNNPALPFGQIQCLTALQRKLNVKNLKILFYLN